MAEGEAITPSFDVVTHCLHVICKRVGEEVGRRANANNRLKLYNICASSETLYEFITNFVSYPSITWENCL